MLTEAGRKLVASGNRNAAIKSLVPKSESDEEFKIAIASELVFAWQDASEAVRPSLERVMFNVGIDKEPNHEEWILQLRERRVYLGSYLK
jgi:hypothetical protein